MFEILLLFTFWPWLLVAAFIAVLGFSAAQETTFFAIIAVILYAGVSFFVYDINILSWIVASPLSAVFALVLYTTAGVVWSLYMWRRHMLGELLQSEMKSAKQKQISVSGSPDGYRESGYFPSSAKAVNNKDRIISWISLWPVSAVWYILDDIVIGFFRNVYEMMGGLYDRVSSRYIP